MAINKFDQLVEALAKGDITPSHIRQALKVYYRHHHPYIPEEAKDIVCGSDGSSGIIGHHWKAMMENIGSLELLYLRLKQGSITLGDEEDGT